MVFFALHCLDYGIDSLVSVLESGRNLMDEHQGDAPDVIEWATTLHYISPNSRPLFELMVLQCIQMGLLNMTGVFGYLRTHRLIPSTFMAILQMAHFWWCVGSNRVGYPIVFYISRLPEALIGVSFVILFVVSHLSAWMTGQPLRKIWDCGISLQDDSNMAIRKIALSLSKKTSGAFSNEMEPVFAPIGVSVPCIRRALPSSPFHNHLEESEVKGWSPQSVLEGSRVHHFFVGLSYTFKLWRVLLGLVLFPIALMRRKLLKWMASVMSKKDLEDECDDPDYIASDSSSDEEEESLDDSEDDEKEDNDGEDSMYKEIFWLAQDLATPNQTKQGPLLSTILPLMAHSQEPGILTRTMRSRSFAPPLLPSQELEVYSGNEPTFEWRACVVCHSEPRTIVLRPCGCLCLCDQGCRESLADRDFRRLNLD